MGSNPRAARLVVEKHWLKSPDAGHNPRESGVNHGVEAQCSGGGDSRARFLFMNRDDVRHDGRFRPENARFRATKPEEATRSTRYPRIKPDERKPCGSFRVASPDEGSPDAKLDPASARFRLTKPDAETPSARFRLTRSEEGDT